MYRFLVFSHHKQHLLDEPTLSCGRVVSVSPSNLPPWLKCMIFAWGLITKACLLFCAILSATLAFGISRCCLALSAIEIESMYLSDSSRGRSRTLTSSRRILSFKQSKWLAFAPLFQNFFNTIFGKLPIHAEFCRISLLNKLNYLGARYVQQMVSAIIYDKSVVYPMVDNISSIAACDAGRIVNNRIWSNSIGQSICKSVSHPIWQSIG